MPSESDAKVFGRFLAKASISPGCWEWLAQRDKDGYGRFGMSGVTWQAHRAAYHLFVSPVTAEQQVLHRCDNPACVNPAHLFIGDHQSNMADRRAKGRYAGAMNGRAKLSYTQVDQVRQRLADGVKTSDVAKQMGVSYGLIYAIRCGRTWRT